jgi:hypothetical protein
MNRLNEVSWDDKNIVVMNSVVISPPYNVSSCHSRNEKENLQAFEHVKKIVIYFFILFLAFFLK